MDHSGHEYGCVTVGVCGVCRLRAAYLSGANGTGSLHFGGCHRREQQGGSPLPGSRGGRGHPGSAGKRGADRSGCGQDSRSSSASSRFPASRRVSSASQSGATWAATGARRSKSSVVNRCVFIAACHSGMPGMVAQSCLRTGTPPTCRPTLVGVIPRGRNEKLGPGTQKRFILSLIWCKRGGEKN